MHKAADLIKKEIVRIDTGNIIGSVVDLLFDPEERHLVALITVSGGWLRDTVLVDWQAVLVWTGDIVLVKPETEPIKASSNERFSKLLERRIHLAGTNVMSRKGVKLGNVGELLLRQSGEIGAYVINRGFLGSERNYVLAEDIVALGSDALIVARDTVRDTLDDPTVTPRPINVKRGFVMPLTGTLVQLNSDDEVAMPEATNDSVETVADSDHVDPPAAIDPDADLPEAMRVPAEPASEHEELPEIMCEVTPVTGETVKLTPEEIDAIVKGEKAMPNQSVDGKQ